MRHHNVTRKFGREKNQRAALMRSLAVSLVTKGKIVTTEAKAKELRPYVEKIITKGKDATLSTKRLLISRLGNSLAVKKIIDEISKKQGARKGGYTRIIKMGQRRGDGSPMAMIEFI